jgi:hypothetical protein
MLGVGVGVGVGVGEDTDTDAAGVGAARLSPPQAAATTAHPRKPPSNLVR